jgi:hypothetical protein
MTEEGTGIAPAEGAVVEDPPASGDGTEAPKGDAVQDRINEITRKRREAEREAAYWRGKAEGAPAPKVEPEQKLVKAEDLEPDDYDSNADYLKAFSVATRAETRAEINAESSKKQVAESHAKTSASYTEGRNEHEDFDSVALNPSVPISQPMFDAAVGPNLHKVLYFLGKNVPEAARISALPPTQQIKEVGLLEAKLTSGVPAKVETNAPDPPKTVGGGGGSPIPKDEAKMNRAELHTKWEAERRKKAGVG